MSTILASKDQEVIRGKVVYLVTIVQLAYPFTAGNQVVALVAYQLRYATLIVAGILVGRVTPLLTRLLIFLGLACFVTGTLYAIRSEPGRELSSAGRLCGQ